MGLYFTYKAFGLIIQSDFEIPEFFVGDGLVDVYIHLGQTPEQLNQITKRGVKYQATKNEFLLEVDRIARFFVKNGNEIIVESKKESPDQEVRLFLLGSAFGALFLQRGLLPIHGSSIKFGQTASIFTGLSGVGKSSIAAYFVKSGFSLLADDISIVNHKLEVVPGFPNMKIWKDVLKKLQVDSSSLSMIRPEMEKFHFPVSENFQTEPLALSHIFILHPKNTDGFECEELTGMKKFNAIKSNTYRYRFVHGLEKQVDHFKILNELLPQIKVFRVSRPQSPILIEEFTAYLIKTFQLDA